MGSFISDLNEQEYDHALSEEASLLKEAIVHLPIARYHVRNALKPEFQSVIRLIIDQARGTVYVGIVASGIKQHQGIWMTREPRESGDLVTIWSRELRGRANNLAVVYWSDRFDEAIHVRDAVIKTLRDNRTWPECIHSYEDYHGYSVYVAWWRPT